VSTQYKLHSFIYHSSGAKKVTNSGHYKVVIREPAYSNSSNSSYVLIDDARSYQINHELAKSEIFNSGEVVPTREKGRRKRHQGNESVDSTSKQEQAVLGKECATIPESVYMLFYELVNTSK